MVADAMKWHCGPPAS